MKLPKFNKKLGLILIAPIVLVVIAISTSAQPSEPVVDTTLSSQNARSSAEKPVTTAPTVTEPTTKTSPTQAKTSQTPALTQPATTTAPAVDRSAYIAACEAAKESQTQLYNANVNAENTRHQTNRSNIESDYRSRGLGYSGLMQEALSKEDQRHQTALASLTASYQQKMSQQCL